MGWPRSGDLPMTSIPLPPSQRDKALSILRAAALSGEILKLEEIALRSGSSLKTAHLARRELIASGELDPASLPALGRRRSTTSRAPAPSARPATSGRPPGTGGLAFSPSDIVQAVLTGESIPLSTEQQRAILSGLILHSPDHNAKIAAQNALTRLDAQAGASLSAGPGVPLTEEARITRLSRLMTACGWITVRKAIKSAFNRDLEAEVQVTPTLSATLTVGPSVVKNVPGA